MQSNQCIHEHAVSAHCLCAYQQQRHFESNKFKFNENMNMDTKRKRNTDGVVVVVVSSVCQSWLMVSWSRGRLLIIIIIRIINDPIVIAFPCC